MLGAALVGSTLSACTASPAATSGTATRPGPDSVRPTSTIGAPPPTSGIEDSGTSPCSHDRDVVSALVDRATEFVDSERTYGVSIAIRGLDGCDLIVTSGLDGRSPATEQTGTGRFPIASVTKTFVAAEIAALAESGALSLDDTIDRWVPEVPNAANIRVVNLLTHTSGLGDAVDTPTWRDALLADPAHLFSVEEGMTIAGLTADHDPGYYEYVNGNFAVAGLIAERVTGRPLAVELRDRFLLPLGLDDTTVGAVGDLGPIEHGWFTMEDNGWGGVQGERGSFDDSIPRDGDLASFVALDGLLSATAAYGGMVSSLDDLLTWGTSLSDGTALGSATDSYFFRPTPIVQSDDTPATTRWGLGWLGHACPCDLEGAAVPSVQFSFHDGETLGSRTMLAVDRENRVTIAIHANTREITDEALLELTVDVRNIVLG